MNIITEALKQLSKYSDYDTVLSYEDLPVTIYTKHHEAEEPSYYSGGESDYYDEKEIEVNYDLEVDGSEIFSALYELLDDEDAEQAKEKENIDDLFNLSLEDSDNYIATYFDDLFKKHEGELKQMFYDKAVKAAQESAQSRYDN